MAVADLSLAPQEARLIDATLICLARWGVAKTTLDDVARQAGCSRATWRAEKSPDRTWSGADTPATHAAITNAQR